MGFALAAIGLWDTIAYAWIATLLLGVVVLVLYAMASNEDFRTGIFIAIFVVLTIWSIVYVFV